MPVPVFLSLAPMEGVMDWVFRDLVTQTGGVDQVTTEFIRVTKNLHPNKVFYRYAPELKMGAKTRSGTPLFIQLLGGEPEPLALNAQRAAELGALGIDLNFGCPAKTVNRHDGGASLLRFPHRLHDITKTVRAAVPSHIPVTAKMRLGFEDTSLCLENAIALDEAGIQNLTVHCRTKKQGYMPPAHWEWLPRIQEKIKTPITANGDITNLESLLKCHEVSGLTRFMIGRQALKNPHIFAQIKSQLLSQNSQAPLNWDQKKTMIWGFFEANRNSINGHYAMARTKQFLRNLSFDCQHSKNVFDQTKVLMKPHLFEPSLEKALLLTTSYEAQ
jgi:tRNA-dihydrouridine synthase C